MNVEKLKNQSQRSSSVVDKVNVRDQSVDLLRAFTYKFVFLWILISHVRQMNFSLCQRCFMNYWDTVLHTHIHKYCTWGSALVFIIYMYVYTVRILFILPIAILLFWSWSTKTSVLHGAISSLFSSQTDVYQQLCLKMRKKLPLWPCTC